MVSNIKRNVIRLIYSYVLRDNVRCAKLLGVRMGERCRVLDEAGAVFGTEPWLIKIGDHVEITHGVKFLSHEGGLWCARELDPEMKDADLLKPTLVGNNVMIGMDSLIMPGITIGDNVIIGAHSVVTRDIPDDTIVAGVPARSISTVSTFVNKAKNSPHLVPIKSLKQTQKLEYMRKYRPEWFE